MEIDETVAVVAGTIARFLVGQQQRWDQRHHNVESKINREDQPAIAISRTSSPSAINFKLELARAPEQRRALF